MQGLKEREDGAHGTSTKLTSYARSSLRDLFSQKTALPATALRHLTDKVTAGKMRWTYSYENASDRVGQILTEEDRGGQFNFRHAHLCEPIDRYPKLRFAGEVDDKKEFDFRSCQHGSRDLHWV